MATRYGHKIVCSSSVHILNTDQQQRHKYVHIHSS